MAGIKVTFCHVLWVALILVSMGIVILGAVLGAEEYSMCYEAYGLGFVFLAAGICLLGSASLGWYALWKERRLCRSLCVVANVILLWALTIMLTVFWGRQATTLYSRADLSDWSDVTSCFVHRDFCGGPHSSHVCCVPPPLCVAPYTDAMRCTLFRNDPHSRCFSCDGCKPALFSAIRDYSLMLTPAIACFSAILLVLVLLQAVMEWYGRASEARGLAAREGPGPKENA